jgi:succinylglutamate desuccinylase
MSLELRGRWISEDVNRLVNLPSWETNAEDALAKAEHQLRRTQQTVEQAQALLARKRPPVAAE